MAKKILVVHDSQTVRAYYRGVLEAAGFELEDAENGREAVEISLHHNFDLFLVDVSMTGVAEIDFLKEIRQRPDLQAIPAVVISSESGDDDLMQSLASGANLHLPKPVLPEVLQEACRILTGRGTARG